ncbi:MAG: hypothetical protein HY898_17490 [Deltaproteobacteria bacterium]|nr:hypothetical protein [Deltaproteobacteria bacterium]
MRSIVEFDNHGSRLLGTYHHPGVRQDKRQAAPVDPGTAFVFFNAGHMPREGHAGLMVQAADHLASQGYPTFRIDLPGLGDSPGVVPASIDSFFRMMHNGLHVSSVLTVLAACRQQYGFSSFVLGGLCGAAVTSILASVQAPLEIAGIVALELELFHPRPESRLRMGQALWSRAAWLRLLTGHGRLGVHVPVPGSLLPKALGRALLPSNTNFELVRALEDFLSRDKPMLLIMASENRRELFYDQVRQAVFGRAAERNIHWRSIAGTNHIFTTGMAHRQVVDEISSWSASHFAPCARDPVPVVEPLVAVRVNMQKDSAVEQPLPRQAASGQREGQRP